MILLVVQKVQINTWAFFHHIFIYCSQVFFRVERYYCSFNSDIICISLVAIDFFSSDVFIYYAIEYFTFIIIDVSKIKLEEFNIRRLTIFLFRASLRRFQHALPNCVRLLVFFYKNIRHTLNVR